jgi:hypothetical protein
MSSGDLNHLIGDYLKFGAPSIFRDAIHESDFNQVVFFVTVTAIL